MRALKSSGLENNPHFSFVLKDGKLSFTYKTTSGKTKETLNCKTSDGSAKFSACGTSVDYTFGAFSTFSDIRCRVFDRYLVINAETDEKVENDGYELVGIFSLDEKD